MLWMMASRFFERWLTSRSKARNVCSRRLRSVTSIAVVIRPVQISVGRLVGVDRYLVPVGGVAVGERGFPGFRGSPACEHGLLGDDDAARLREREGIRSRSCPSHRDRSTRAERSAPRRHAATDPDRAGRCRYGAARASGCGSTRRCRPENARSWCQSAFSPPSSSPPRGHIDQPIRSSRCELNGPALKQVPPAKASFENADRRL